MHARNAKPYSNAYQLGMYIIAASVSLLVIAVNSMFAPGSTPNALLQGTMAAPDIGAFVDCCVRYATVGQKVEAPVLPVMEETIDEAETPLAVETAEIKEYNASFSEAEKKTIHDIAAEYGVDEGVVLGICYHESHFRPNAIGENENGTRDWGISQCNDTTFEFLSRRIGISDMSQCLDMVTGIRACCALLAYYQELGLTGDDALLAYQQGYNSFLAVKSGIAQPWAAFEETKPSIAAFQNYLDAMDA